MSPELVVRIIPCADIILNYTWRRRLAELIPKPLVVVPRVVLADLECQAQIAKQFVGSRSSFDSGIRDLQALRVWDGVENLIQSRIWGTCGNVSAGAFSSEISYGLEVMRDIRELEERLGQPAILATFNKKFLRLAIYEGVRKVVAFRNGKCDDFMLPLLGDRRTQ